MVEKGVISKKQKQTSVRCHNVVSSHLTGTPCIKRQHGKNKQQLSAQLWNIPTRILRNLLPASPSLTCCQLCCLLMRLKSSTKQQVLTSSILVFQSKSLLPLPVVKLLHAGMSEMLASPPGNWGKHRKTKCLHWQVGLQNLTETFWNLHMELSAVRTCWNNAECFYIECHQVRRKDEKSTFRSDRSQYIHQNISLFLSWWFTNTTQDTSGAKPSGGKLAGR